MRWGVMALIVLILNGCAGAVVVGTVGGAMMLNDRRSVGSQFDDQTLEVKVNNALNADDGVKNQTHITAVSMNQAILLVGQAPNEMLRSKAVELVRPLREVRVVHNQVRIGNPVGFSTISNDSWITTKVKSRMLTAEEFDSTRVKVITENAEVFLLGLVTREEAEKAVEIARNTSGVRKVVKVFEFL
ncbi:Osmotically-inducible protein OsmY, contains BON domain [Ferrimonas sediminum]|uniref:Osmotically-inducible protein OsmY, contains BON domain n=1 Tax=Ferrimonas sediminum TaxID=718193 RepID=A0A1G8V4M9_9GAMM|nr:division/outer membrane stress-associated lipid-binding lipoprotein [Ferrimonas sediminum]SDJ61096.1 Osmotically-inducible protein OsmY, contains BON domain [Ferrimonas sediminum]